MDAVLAYTVHVEGRIYLAGTTPPVEVAKKITNSQAWEGGEVPDLGDETDDPKRVNEGATLGAATPGTGAAGGLGGDAALPTGDQDVDEDHVAPGAQSLIDNGGYARMAVDAPDGSGSPVTPTGTAGVEVPAGNASADKWRAYAVASDQATAEEVADMTRDELRDTYGPKA